MADYAGSCRDNLVRFGIKVDIVDNRPDRTSTGRADGIQPKTIETLRQMRLADPVLRKGVRIYDIAFWVRLYSKKNFIEAGQWLISHINLQRSTFKETLHRTSREIHYPPVVDLLDPYILLVHQGMVESLFVNDLKERGVKVERNTAFVDYENAPGKSCPLEVTCKANVDQARRSLATKYLVGCDGAHSQVRKCLPGSRPVGSSYDAIWGVLDGQLETDFPDIWSKAIVYSEESGSVLIIPRERNLTRLYIEVKSDTEDGQAQEEHTKEFVMRRAQEIMEPYRLRWRTVGECNVQFPQNS